MQLAIRWSGISHLHPMWKKSNCLSHIVIPFMDVLFGVILTRTLLENLLSVIVTHSSILRPQIHQLEFGICNEHN